MTAKKELQRLNEKFIGVCDKQYKVGYIPYGCFNNDIDTKFITGEMINYNSGNIILINDDGVWHIPYNAVRWVLPIKE